MNVKLIACTPDALEVLLYTKETRLSGFSRSLAAIHDWDAERKRTNLDYMLKTIKSSWEFIDYIFEINVVSRSFTHQVERHRVGTSFAEQSQRAVSVAENEIVIPDGMTDRQQEEFVLMVNRILEQYQWLVDDGVELGSARQLIPQAVSTNLIMKANLRTLHDMAKIRLCVKTQGEFQKVFRQMKARVVEVHPWAEPMIQVHCATEGTCAFPNLPTEKCPVKPHVYDQYRAESYGMELWRSGGSKDEDYNGELWPVGIIADFWQIHDVAEAPVRVHPS